MNIITDFVPLVTIYIAAFLVMMGFFVLALQLFVTLISFKLGALAAFVALPWGVFAGTSWVAERPLGWVAASAMRLFVLGFVASIAITFSASLPAVLTLEAGGALNILLFGLTVLALAWFAPVLASEVVQGQPNLSGPDAMRAGLGMAVTGGAGAAAAWVTGAQALKFGGGAAARMRRALSGRSNSGGGANAGGGARSINYAAMAPRTPPPSTGERS